MPALQSTLAGILVLLGGSYWGAAAEPAATEPTAAGDPSASAPAGLPRLREGSAVVDQIGTFKLVGERLVFHPEAGGIPLVALENFSLERIAKAVASHPRSPRWKISGTVTEYQGANYLLIERALLKSETWGPRPGGLRPEGEPPGGKNRANGIAPDALRR